MSRLKDKNKAWEKIFEDYNIYDEIKSNGTYEITSSVINEYYEARLMTKFDNSGELPDCFKITNEEDITILPTDRGKYLLGRFDIFKKINYNSKNVVNLSTESTFDTLNKNDFTHETSALLNAYYSGAFKSIIGDYGDSLKFTRFGRTSCGEWDYSIKINKNETYAVNVKNAQIEMDGVFESDDCVLNCEVKCVTEGNILLRQLYYPYRYLRTLTDKPIINMFITVSQGSLYIHTYEVTNDMDYNSFKDDKQYRFDYFEPIDKSSFNDIINNTRFESEIQQSILPQADSMQRVIDVLAFLKDNPESKDSEIAEDIGYDYRQGGYYANACYYLGLTTRTKNGNTYYNRLNDLGSKIIRSSFLDRNKLLVKTLMKHEIISKYLKKVNDGDNIEKKEIEELIPEYIVKNNLKKVDDNTIGRRASTIISWIKWAQSVCEKNVL